MGMPNVLADHGKKVKRGSSGKCIPSQIRYFTTNTTEEPQKPTEKKKTGRSLTRNSRNTPKITKPNLKNFKITS